MSNQYFVEGTTCDGGDVEKLFEGENSLHLACLFAQGIEEDGGSALVVTEHGEVIDHWKGYQIALVPNDTNDSISLALGSNLISGVTTGMEADHG